MQMRTPMQIDREGKSVIKPGKQCKAKSKRSAEQCKNLAVTGRDVCRMHGGKTPNGIASPNFKNGLYSQLATAAFGPLFAEIRGDVDLGELRDDLGVFVALAKEKLGEIATGESATAWKVLRKLYADLLTAEAKGNVADMQASIAAMGEIIQRGALAHAAREELAELLEKRSRVADRENKRLDSKYRAITIDKAMVILIAIANSIRMAVEGAAINEREKRRILTATASAFQRFAGDDLGALPCSTGRAL